MESVIDQRLKLLNALAISMSQITSQIKLVINRLPMRSTDTQGSSIDLIEK